MKKRAIILSIVMTMGILLTGCNSSKTPEVTTPSTDKAPMKTITLKAATNNPKSSGHYKGLEIFKELVEERTKGAVTVELYSDAVLGDEEQMAEGMQMGTVDVMMAAAAKYANFVPEMDLLSPPYLFKSWDHYKEVLANKDIMDKIANATKERRGDIFLGVFTDGLRNVFTRKPVKSLDEMKGIKLRTMTGPNETNSWKALMTNPTPLAYTELYAALQSGVVDGAENSMAAIVNMKFFESCKYVLRTGHSYLALPFFISGKALEKIPADLRETVIQAGRDTCSAQVDWAIQNDKASEATLTSKYGVTVLDFSKEDMEKAIELCQPVQNANAKRIKMEAELGKIREIGKKY